MPESCYATPVRGLTADRCGVYHRQVIPALKDRKEWQWDLIGDEAAYFGGFDFSGKRVLELGCADGYLTFWMERQGAEAVGLDLSPDTDRHPWDILAREGDDDIAEFKRRMSIMMANLNKTFWLAHEAHNSKARLVHATAYDIPRGIGTFDVVTLAAILTHLRDPLRALEHALEFTRDSIIITELVPYWLAKEDLAKSIASFLPNPTSGPHGGTSWWVCTPAAYERYFQLRNFKIKGKSQGMFRFKGGKPLEVFQIIASRR